MDSYDLQIYKGATYSLSLTVKDGAGTPINLTNYDISGFLKFKYSDSGYLVNLNPTKTNPTGGVISLSIPASGSENLPITIGFFDIEINQSGIVTKVLRGKGYVNPEVTF